ncbi:hypothetical protein [Flavihumibacter fluvii]|uniref:hypothetical protein n=1 Tax=Flavihumibacter fluvii TaxID=2838157 RepID=UPI001BDE00A4|nr:hypothetical protein [Flavihumibacter fluvii]ULQ52118.1 hypothetical protein KJS93_18655 [Flavihumibacter fluvii]
MKKLSSTILIYFFAVHFCAAQKDSTRNNIIYPAPWFVEKFQVFAGTFMPISNINVQVSNTSGNIGTEIDFENDLGFDKTFVTFIADFQYRLKRRSRLDLSYYRFNRYSTTRLNKDINFGDNTYLANSIANSIFNTQIYRLSYGYSVIEKPKYELGFLIGAHIVKADSEMSADTTIGTFTTKDEFGFTAPLPNLGIWGGYALSDRLAITGEFSYLSLTVNETSGRIVALSVFFLFRVASYLNLSLGYSGLNVKIDATKPKLTGQFIWGYNGPSLTATFSFGKKYWTHK